MPEHFKKPSSAACPGAACAGCADPMCMADGGRVEPSINLESVAPTQEAEPKMGPEEGEDEIQGMLGDELMSAFESKDRKRVMEGLEALIMSCMNKRGET